MKAAVKIATNDIAAATMPMMEPVSRPWEVEEGLGVTVGLEDTTVVPAAGV